MKNSKIAWTDHTFNPWWGCVKVSDGCKNCYAATFSKRTGQDVWGVDKPRRFFGENHWAEPLKWDKEARLDGVRRRVFCASMADVFEDREDLVEPRVRLLDLICRTDSLDWLILTKRPENIKRLMYGRYVPLWLGTTVENQAMHNKRVGPLMEAKANVHFLSIEPQLEPVVLSELQEYTPDWIIVGGESGAGCRPFNLDWARSIRDQCKRSGTAFFMKQLGGIQNHHSEIEDFPEDLRIREFPGSRGDK